MHRVHIFKTWLWAITGLAASAGVARFMFGLGATTNLSDSTPWGFWIGFDVMSGVALAAGGFVITATVYIFQHEEFHPIVRPAVLTAFLGYLAVAIGLVFDLGLPWNMWHMTVYWNQHSALFEVGWCVMLYLTVLALEFFPVPLESFPRLHKFRKVLVRFRLPLVILGIMLSTLHQSSLGSLFLIMPHRVHPLWYSQIMPILFFISAIGLGLMMVTLESLITTFIYEREPETRLLAKLGKICRWVLIIYIIIRFTDLGIRGQFVHLFDPGWRTAMFWSEILISTVIPIVLLFTSLRSRGVGQWIIASLTVTGVVLNRVNVGGLTHIDRGGVDYFPAWTELAISAGIVSGAILVFLFVIEHYNLWEERPRHLLRGRIRLPRFDRDILTRLGIPLDALKARYSFAFIALAAIGFALTSNEAASTRSVEQTPVHRARGGSDLWIDGNLDGFGAMFPHTGHISSQGDDKSCVICHHMNLPRDENSGCYECHSDMYRVTDAFDHDYHSSPVGARLHCSDCHALKEVRSGKTATTCVECHGDLVPDGATIEVNQYIAPSYADAMHNLCIGCHKVYAEDYDLPELSACGLCHSETLDFIDNEDIAPRYRERQSKRVVTPNLAVKKR
ncbi:NrfD/PsrC family molybdoenzyme membrane anchor subunit [Calditrichota bacterium]